MQLLNEQKVYLEEKISTLLEQEAKLREQKKLCQEKPTVVIDYIQEDINHLNDLLTNLISQRKEYESVLQQGTVISRINNQQIDVGTVFEIEMEQENDFIQGTLIEIPIDKKFSSLSGYITKGSLFGKAIYGKKPGEVFSYSVSSNGDIKTFQGTVLRIIPQKSSIVSTSLSSKKENVKIDCVGQKERNSKRPKSKKKYSYRGLTAYKSMLEKYQDNWAVQEKLRLNSITENQKAYLEKYLEEWRVHVLQERINSEPIKSLVQILLSFQKAIRKNVIVPRSNKQVELGKNVLLEIELENGKKVLEQKELVPHYYAKEQENGMLPLSVQIGFTVYRAHINDTFKLQKTKVNKAKTVRVAQFGITRDTLLNPISLNSTQISKDEKRKIIEEKRTLELLQPVMTQSQKELLEIEFEKAASCTVDSPYISYLHMLKNKVENGEIQVANRQENTEKANIGNIISYTILEDGILTQKTTELIQLAYTTESKDNYTEVLSPLGRMLFGCMEQDTFSYMKNNKKIAGEILSIQNSVEKRIPENQPTLEKRRQATK